MKIISANKMFLSRNNTTKHKVDSKKCFRKVMIDFCDFLFLFPILRLQLLKVVFKYIFFNTVIWWQTYGN